MSPNPLPFPSVPLKRFTEDRIEIHGEKIDLEGNVIDLGMFRSISPRPPSLLLYPGTRISVDDFMLKMYPHLTTRTFFKYPCGRLLQLRDVIKENEVHHPTTLDVNGEECLLAVKNGNSTSVTIGRATTIMCFVRECFEDGTYETSMELVIYSYGNKDGASPEMGDSGSIIADGKERIVGLLTDGASRQIPPTSRTRRLPTGSFTSVSGCIFPTPISAWSRPRRRDINLERHRVS